MSFIKYYFEVYLELSSLLQKIISFKGLTEDDYNKSCKVIHYNKGNK